MNCPTCGIAMIRRTGKFGPFFYCASHGTISERAAELITQLQRLRDMDVNSYYAPPTDLDFEIRKQCINLGQPMSSDDQNLLDWIVDGDPEDDEEDHWKNMRPW